MDPAGGRLQDPGTGSRTLERGPQTGLAGLEGPSGGSQDRLDGLEGGWNASLAFGNPISQFLDPIFLKLGSVFYKFLFFRPRFSKNGVCFLFFRPPFPKNGACFFMKFYFWAPVFLKTGSDFYTFLIFPYFQGPVFYKIGPTFFKWKHFSYLWGRVF